MSDADRPPWPFDEPGTIDIGHGIALRWDSDGRGLIWHHPSCRAWSSLRFVPDLSSTGHRLVSGGPDDLEHLTIAGSLLCPRRDACPSRCHDLITNGRWVPA
jgi:hypothetical protein